jgi:CRP-like cAMP-binding protein/CheY-like chemotaxis protein
MPLAFDRSQPRILVVEDNHLIADELSDFMRGCGYAVVGATPSIEGGLRLVEDGGLDGAVLDVDLAGRPSFPLCSALQAKGVPFLFLTGYGRDTVPPEFRAAPYVATPFDRSVLRAALDTLVALRQAARHFGNLVLDAVPFGQRTGLAALLERVELKAGEVLDSPGRPVTHVHFPLDSLLSLFVRAASGKRIEAASIGNDGMTAMGMLLGEKTASGETVVQVAGVAWRAPLRDFLVQVDQSPVLRGHLLDHVGTALRQIMGTVLFTGRATIVERLAWWLLQADRRLGARPMPLTHDMLSEILGVRRSSITTALHLLEGKRLIKATRCTIMVLDAKRLAGETRRLTMPA